MSSVSANFQNTSITSSCDKACGGTNKKEVFFRRGPPPPAFTIKEEEFEDDGTKMVNATTGQGGRNNSRFSRRSSGQRSCASADCSTSRSSYMRVPKYRNDSFKDLASINTSYSTSRSQYPNTKTPEYERYPLDSFRELPSADNTALSNINTSQSSRASSKRKNTNCSTECSTVQNNDFSPFVSSTPFHPRRNSNSPKRNVTNSMRFASPFTSTVATAGSSCNQNAVSLRQHAKEAKLPKHYYEEFPSVSYQEDGHESTRSTIISPGISASRTTGCGTSSLACVSYGSSPQNQGRDLVDSGQATTSGSMQSPASISVREHLKEPVVLPRQFYEEHPSTECPSVCVGTFHSIYDLESASRAGANVDMLGVPPHKRPRSFGPEYYETIFEPHETNPCPNYCRKLFTTESSVHDPSSLNTSPCQQYPEQQQSQQQSMQAQRSFYNNTGAYQDTQYESTAYNDLPNFGQQHESTVYGDLPNIGRPHESTVYADLPNTRPQFESTAYGDLPSMTPQQSFRERSPQRQRSAYVDSYPREQQRSAPCSRECSRSTPQRQQSYEECPNERGLTCTCDLSDERSIHNKKKQICKEASEKLKSFKRELEHELYVMEGEEFTEMDKNLKKWQKMRRKIMMKFLCVQFLRDLEKGDRSRNRSGPTQEDCPC